MNGTLTMTPVGTVTHSLSESQGTLSLSAFQASTVKALANDVTVCGEVEPSAYVTEYFQGDGTTVLFDLTEEPWMPPPSKTKPLNDSFQGPAINTQIWNIEDPGAALTLTSAGLTCGGGASNLGSVVLSAISNLELGGGLIIEAGGVQFGQNTSGIINGLFSAGETGLSACVAGFQISQVDSATIIAPIMNGYVSTRTIYSESCNPTMSSARTMRSNCSGRICSRPSPVSSSKCRTPPTESPARPPCSTQAPTPRPRRIACSRR